MARADGALDGALIIQEGREVRDTKDFLLGKKVFAANNKTLRETVTLRSLFTKRHIKVLTTEEVNEEEDGKNQNNKKCFCFSPAATHHLFSVKLSLP